MRILPGHFGHQIIDEQHAHLFETLQRVRTLSQPDVFGLRAEVAKLGDYVDGHFRHQEEMMHRAQYPQTAEHVAEHAAIRGEMQVLGRLSEYGFRDALNVVATALTGWMREHVSKRDRQFAEFLNAERTVPAAPAPTGSAVPTKPPLRPGTVRRQSLVSGTPAGLRENSDAKTTADCSDREHATDSIA